MQISVGVAFVLTGESSRAHEPLAALHVAGAGEVWASLVAVVALVGTPSRRRGLVGLGWRHPGTA